MDSRSSFNAFVFAQTFNRQEPKVVLAELQGAGLTGINLALNYHSSRDFLLRQGPHLEYLQEGFHYYFPNFSSYNESAIKPAQGSYYENNLLLDLISEETRRVDFDLNAWCVYLHNFNLGSRNPTATVTNVYGNQFLSELCPAHPAVREYAIGLSRDLCSRGIKKLLVESVRFHGLMHGEHHERFFLQMSKITEFLLYLCFCNSCTTEFSKRGGDPEALRNKVKFALDNFINESDSWLGLKLSITTLQEILGSEILMYLSSREATVTSLYAEICKVAQASGVQVQFLDPSTLQDKDSLHPLDDAWLAGHDAKAIGNLVDIFEPIFFETKLSDIAQVVSHFQKELTSPVAAAVSPMYPYISNKAELVEKVAGLLACDIKQVDFYLLDVMRKRDLVWITEAITAG
ncbi:MAG: hypothetical protein EB067_05430 [Actinobacteria bacterium]|nr:hypothetical protein [Actinomycetota bacterium]